MSDLSKKICFRPWEFMEIQDDTTIFPCCPNWINQYNFGKSSNSFNFEQSWNGDKAKRFRDSILDGSYKYCNKTQCPMIQNGTLPDVQDVADGKYGEDRRNIVVNKINTSKNPEFINFCYDKSCNLKCPSCRANFYFLNEKTNVDEYVLKSQFQEKLTEYLYSCTNRTVVNITGSGDPFASKLFWEFLTNFDGQRNLNVEFQLQTNGVLFTRENWDKLHKIHNNNINAIISIDAGTKETYALTRRGGDWDKLMKNLEFVQELNQSGKVKWVRLDFVCQQKNYKEIPLFIDIAKKHDFNCYLSRIVNWGTFTDQQFAKENIFDISHPEHQYFLDVIRQHYNYNLIDFGNLSEYRV